MKKYKYTIVTPVYNREKSIVRCIESVLRQNYNKFEFIIINDGSVDGTKRVIENYSNKDSRLVLINLKENRGVNFARNRGIENTSGDFIIFLDSDDWFADAILAEVNNEINKNQGYSHYLFTVSDRMKDTSLPENYARMYYKDWLTRKITGDFTSVIKPNCFKHKLFWEQFNGYEGLNWLRVMKGSQPMLFINKVIVHIERDREDSLSRMLFSDNTNKIREKYKAGLLYFKLYKEDLLKYNYSPQKKLFRTIIFGKIIKKSNDELLNLMKMQDWFLWFLIKILPAFFWEKLIIFNAKRKRGKCHLMEK